MTNRLYYDDAYMKQFGATVLEIRAKDAHTLVRLDRSAFYPTSGGQTHDTGTLNGARVQNVFVSEDGEVWHEVDTPLSQGDPVTGIIDWPRRFDHMQQHAGEHMLAGALYRKTGGHTIGLHLGAEISTIDVQMPDGSMRVPKEILDELEDEVNALIQENLPIRCWFPSGEELRELPLRKPPTVNAHVRVVAIGEEMVACGGTHPSSAGQIGLIKILDARPSKGKMRITFVCGMRAFHDYRARFDAAGKAAELLSTHVTNLPDAVARIQTEAKDAAAEANRLRREAAFKQIDELLKTAQPAPDGWRVVAKSFDQYDMVSLRDIASSLIGRERVYALLASEQKDGLLLLFARSGGSDIDLGKLLGETARAHNGKGGGRPDFAQGSAQRGEALQDAGEKLHKILVSKPK